MREIQAARTRTLRRLPWRNLARQTYVIIIIVLVLELDVDCDKDDEEPRRSQCPATYVRSIYKLVSVEKY